MYPILLPLDFITVSSLWVFLALSFFLTLIIINKLSKQKLVKLNFLADHSLLIFLSGLICSRIVFLIRNFNEFFNEISVNKILEIFYIWDKGLSIWGAIIGIFLSIFLLARKEEENFLAWADILVVSLISGMVLSNIGTFLDGKNYGQPTSLPWGVIIETSQYAIPIHPTQIYASIYNLLIALFLILIFNKKFAKKDGTISLIGIFLYSIFRFIEEFLRGDESNYIFVFREAQIYCLIALIISGYFLYQKIKKQEFTS